MTNGHASLRWLAAQPSNIKEANEAVQHIIRDANRASDVISRIRGFIKRGQPHRSEVDIVEIIDDVIAVVQDEARSIGVSLAGKSGADLPSVVVDRVQLQQVILNLLMNAIESTTMVTGRPRTVYVWADRYSSDSIQVAVRDFGAGLDEENKNLIFDAFYTTKPTGMGMGLTISRSIVESHGGRLWVTQNEGPGVTFRFTLPIANTEQS